MRYSSKIFFILVITVLINACASKTFVPIARTQVLSPVVESTPVLPKQKFPTGWVTYTNANEEIRDLAFDKNGSLWAASRGGLVKWNIQNETYQKYTTADGLPSNRIDSILVTEGDILWIGTPTGIANFDGNEWSIQETLDQYSSVNDIFQDAKGTIWFTGNGALTYDGTSWNTYTMEDGLGSNATTSVIEDQKGNIWLGTWFSYCGCEGAPKYIEGVSRFNGKKWDVLGKQLGLDDGDAVSGIRVEAMAVDHKGGIWFGTYGYGVIYFNGKNYEKFRIADNFSDNSVNDIQVASDGVVWFAAPKGLGSYNGKEWRWLWDHTAEDPTALSIAIAPDQTIWVGRKSGISHFDGENWKTYKTNDILLSTIVNDIDTTEEGVVWFATNNGALSFDGTNSISLTKEDGLLNETISAIAIDPKRGLWLGMAGVPPNKLGSIALYDGKGWISYAADERLVRDIRYEGVYDIVVEPNGILWIASYSIWRFDGQNWSQFGWEGGQSPDVRRSKYIAFSSNTNFWAGGWGGVTNFDNQHWVGYGPINQNKVGWDARALAVAPNGDIWVASELSDETSHEKTAFKSFNGKEWKLETILELRAVTDMDFTSTSTLWVATRDGVYKYESKKWTHYTIHDGLAGNEVLKIHVAMDGSIWFATTDGLTHFNPPS